MPTGRATIPQYPAPYPLVFRLLVEPSVELLCFHHVYKGIAVNLSDGRDKLLHFGGGHNRVKHCALFFLVNAVSLEVSRPVVSHFVDDSVNFIRLVGDDKEGLLLVIPVEDSQGNRSGVLEDDGVQGFVQVEEKGADAENNAVSGENVVPGVFAVLFGNKNRDEIRAA